MGVASCDLLRSYKSFSNLKSAGNKGTAKVWKRNKEKELHHIQQRVPWAIWKEWLIGREGRRSHRTFQPRKPKPVACGPQFLPPKGGTHPKYLSLWLALTLMEGHLDQADFPLKEQNLFWWLHALLKSLKMGGLKVGKESHV